MSRYRQCGRWAREFLVGDYKGPPIDFVMALAAVCTMIAVVIVT